VRKTFFDAGETRLGHAKNSIGRTVDGGRAAGHVRIGAHARLPPLVGNDGDAVVILPQQPAQIQAHAQGFEVIAGYQLSGRALRIGIQRDGEGAQQRLESRIAAQRIVERIVQQPRIFRRCEPHQLPGLAHRDEPQQRGVHDGEQRRHRADP
jgi:hypothetical protein